MDLKSSVIQAKQIFKRSRVELCALSVIIIFYFIGLCFIRSKFLSFFHGIPKLFVLFPSATLIEILLAPLIVGAYQWTHSLLTGKSSPMKEAFLPFSDLISIIESIKIFLKTVFIFRISFMPFIFTLFISVILPAGKIYYNILFVIFAFAVSARLLCGSFPFMHILIAAPHIKTLKALKLSFKIMRGNFGDFCKISISAISGLVFSLFLLGIPLAYLLPAFFCKAVAYCDNLFEKHCLYKYNSYY